MLTVGVPDDVWDQLDPAAARLSGRARIKLAAWVLAAALLGLGLLSITASGLFIHRFSVSGIGISSGQDGCHETLTIYNHGWLDEQVTGEQLLPNGTGAALLKAFRGAIPSGGSRQIPVNYPINWCPRLERAFPEQLSELDAPELRLRLNRPWGESTATVVLRPEPPAQGFTLHW